MSVHSSGGQSSESNSDSDPFLYEIILVDQLPSDAWAEGIALRPNGNVLTSRIDEPELYAIDLASTKLDNFNPFAVIRPKLVHTFENATGVFNLGALKGAEREEYAVISGWADLANANFHSFTLWRVAPVPDNSEPPEVTKIADLKEGEFCMGIDVLTEKTLLIADAHKSCIWKVDIPTGTVTELLSDPVMQPREGEFFGVNRLHLLNGYIWFTNTSTGTLTRVPVEHNGDDVKILGPVEPVAEGLPNAEGLVMFDDASVAYCVSYAEGFLWRIDIDKATGKGTVTVLREDLVSPTAMELRYEKGEDKPTLYILCCGAVDESALNAERGTWFDLAKVRDKVQITVTVTTEVTYEYI